MEKKYLKKKLQKVSRHMYVCFCLTVPFGLFDDNTSIEIEFILKNL